MALDQEIQYRFSFGSIFQRIISEKPSRSGGGKTAKEREGKMREVIRVHYEPPVRTLNGWDMKIAGTETKIEQEECDMANNNLMSRERQIEEMAKTTMKHCEIDNQCGSCHWSTCNECLAEVFYNAGYRKQSEIADDIIAIIEQRMSRNIERLNGCQSDIWKVGYLTKNEAYQDIKEIIEQRMKGGAE